MNKRTLGTIEVTITYVCWGLLTLFWNLLSEVNLMYILAQRILWSMVFMGIYMVIVKKGSEIKEVFKDKKKLMICFVCGVLVTINWGTYIFAVNSGHVLDASLGYFIEPVLVSIIGMLVFKEKLNAMEKVTFTFSIVGLVYMIVATKTFPILALAIAGSFAIYGGVKKRLDITPHASLFMETLMMTPFALIFTIYGDMNGMGSFGVLHGMSLLLLPLCGIITSVPLLLFNIGVKEIPYYIAGILMYINPTLQFIMGLFYFGEELNVNQLIAFVIIWIGICFTIYDKLRIMVNDRKKIAVAE